MYAQQKKYLGVYRPFYLTEIPKKIIEYIKN